MAFGLLFAACNNNKNPNLKILQIIIIPVKEIKIKIIQINLIINLIMKGIKIMVLEKIKKMKDK